MHRELYQICRVAAAARHALRYGVAMEYQPLNYERKIEFRCLPEKRRLRLPFERRSGGQFSLFDSVESWFAFCVRRKLEAVQLLLPTSAWERQEMGCPNSTESALGCRYQGGETTYCSADWLFDPARHRWDIRYTEYTWAAPPGCDLPPEDPEEAFRAVLERAASFAHRIDCDNFAALFRNAADVLDGSEDYIDLRSELPLPQLPRPRLRLFEAASAADVFGGKGSWNDSPYFLAHKKGLDSEYAMLTAELQKQLRLAVLCAVNGW